MLKHFLDGQRNLFTLLRYPSFSSSGGMWVTASHRHGSRIADMGEDRDRHALRFFKAG